MNVIVPVCDKYNHIVRANAALLNKYWPGQDITVLCYSTERLGELPSNVEVVSLGKQEDFGRSWTTGLIPFFEHTDIDHFALVMDDCPPAFTVNAETAERLRQHVADGKADKAMLHSHMNFAAGRPHEEEGLLRIAEDATYRANLHPAVWSTAYFRTFLFPDLSPWDFEVRNPVVDRGAQISSVSSNHRFDHVFPCFDLFRKGKVNRSDYWGLGHPGIDPADVALIEECLRG